MKFAGPWRYTPDGKTMYRAISGRPTDNPINWVARVTHESAQVRFADATQEPDDIKWVAWKGKPACPEDDDAQKWCDAMLEQLGYSVASSDLPTLRSPSYGRALKKAIASAVHGAIIDGSPCDDDLHLIRVRILEMAIEARREASKKVR